MDGTLESQANLFGSFADCGGPGIYIAGVHPSAWQGHVTGPGVELVLGPADQAQVQVGRLTGKYQRHGGLHAARWLVVTRRGGQSLADDLQVRCIYRWHESLVKEREPAVWIRRRYGIQ